MNSTEISRRSVDMCLLCAGTDGTSADMMSTQTGGGALVAVSNAVNLGKLFKQSILTGEREALKSFNETYLNEVKLVEPEEIVYKGAKGWDLHGWLMKPVGYEAGQKYPPIVEIHGGPAAMYANPFSMSCNCWRQKHTVSNMQIHEEVTGIARNSSMPFVVIMAAEIMKILWLDLIMCLMGINSY